MRSVSKRVRRAGGLLALLVFLIAPTATADETSFLTWLAARIGNPGGVSTQQQAESSLMAEFLAWLEARIGNPGG
jgi:hypothetical protein